MNSHRYSQPISAEDLYCHYCSKQYKTLHTFKHHIVDQHGLGMAAILELLTDEEEADRQRLMAEKGKSDDERYVAMLKRARQRRGKR